MFFNVNVSVPLSGVAGLNLLKKNRDTQEALLRENTQIKREATYFAENISSVSSADDLVDDPRLLRVALEAYGLGDEFAKKAYIKNILNSDINDARSAVNRVSDPRWQSFARAFIKSDITVPGPLNDDFAFKTSGRAYAVELTKYTSDKNIEKITNSATEFRTLMKDIKTPEQLVNNKTALKFVKQAFSLSDSAASNDDIVKYLSANNEFLLNNDGSAVVPDEWKEARKTLTFFDETILNGSTAKIDKKANSPVTIEKVVLQRFRQELAVQTGAYDYKITQENFKNAVHDYKNADDLIADKTTLNFLKQAYNLGNDTASDADIKYYLTSQTDNNIPDAWKNVRNILGFHTTAITPATTDMTDFKNTLASYNNVDDLLNDTDTLNILKTAYELNHDDASPETIKSYLTATDENDVPAAWRELRSSLGFHNNTAPADSGVIDDFAQLYQIATGTRADLTEGMSYTNIGIVTKRHTDYNISYTSNIAKFDRFKKEADNYELSIGLVGSENEITSNSRALRFALTAFGLDAESFDSYKASKVLSGDYKLSDSSTDKKWRDFRENFSFSAAANNLKTNDKDFSKKIIDDFIDNSFVEAVGEQDPTMRLALYFDKRIQEVASTTTADTNGWFNVIGETPLATVFQTAFGLPSSFGNLDIDAQRDVYKIRSKAVAGSEKLSAYNDKSFRDRFIETYLLRASIAEQSASSSPASILLG